MTNSPNVLSDQKFEVFLNQAMLPTGTGSWYFSSTGEKQHEFLDYTCSGVLSSNTHQSTKGYWQNFQFSVNIPVFSLRLPDISYIGAIFGSIFADTFLFLVENRALVKNQQIFVELANLWVELVGRPLSQPEYYENDFISIHLLNSDGNPLKSSSVSRIQGKLLRDYFLYSLPQEIFTVQILELIQNIPRKDLLRLRMALYFARIFELKELSIQDNVKITGTEITSSDSAWISSEVRPDSNTHTARIVFHFSKFFSFPMVLSSTADTAKRDQLNLFTGCSSRNCSGKIYRLFSKSKTSKAKLLFGPKGIELHTGGGTNCFLECVFYYYKKLDLTKKLEIFKKRQLVVDNLKKLINLSDSSLIFSMMASAPFSIVACIETDDGKFEKKFLFTALKSIYPSLNLLVYKGDNDKTWHSVVVSNYEDYLNKVKCKVCSEYYDSNSPHLSKCARCSDCLKFYQVNGNHYLSCKKVPFGLLKKKNLPIKTRTVEVREENAQKWQLFKNVWFCDFECFPTKEGIHVPYLIVLKEINQTNEFHCFFGKSCLEDFINFILKGKKVSGYLFCHNGSGYDFNLILLGILRHGNIPEKGLQILSRGTKILSAKIKSKPFSLELRDSYLYLPSSLSRLCKDFKIEQSKAKLAFDHSKIKSFTDFGIHLSEALTYCKQDVVALEEIYKKFSEGLWKIAPVLLPRNMSLAAHALEMWKHMEDPKIIESISIPNFDHYNILRDMYHGGRVLCTTQKYDSFIVDQLYEMNQDGSPTFWDEKSSLSYDSFDAISSLFKNLPTWKKEELKIVDVVSLYPYCMHKFTFPVGEYQGLAEFKLPDDQISKAVLMMKTILEGKRPIINGSPLFNLAYVIQKQEMFRSCYNVDIICPDKIFVAFLMRKNNGTPEQSLEPLTNHWVTGVELFEAIKIGYKVTKIKAKMSWEKSKPIFKNYIQTLFDLKEKHKSDKTNVMYIVAKLLMNALSGKFGQKIVSKVITLLNKLPDDPDEMFQELINVSMQVVDHQNVVTQEVETIGYIFSGDKQEKDLHTNLPTQISVFILAHSRRVMSKILRKINGYNDEKNTFLYTDTDSLVVRKSTFDLLKFHGFIGSNLGQLTDEYPKDIIVAGRFLAPKTYCLCMLREVEGKAATCYKIRCKGIPHRNDEFLARDYTLCEDSFDVQLKNIDDSLSGPVGDLGKRFYVVKEKGSHEKVAVNPFINLEICNMILSDKYFLEVHFGSIIKSRDKAQKFHLKTTWTHRSLGLQSWWNKPNCPRIANKDPYAITYPKGAKLQVVENLPKELYITPQNQEEVDELQTYMNLWLQNTNPGTPSHEIINVNDNTDDEEALPYDEPLLIPDPEGDGGHYELTSKGQLSYEDAEGFGVDIL